MTDRELQEHIQKALDWEPSVDAAAIGISVDDGVVTLRGDVKTYIERDAAERVALKVWGVRAVANDLAVRLDGQLQRTDTEIAQAAANALSWNTVVPAGKVTVTVSHGWVSLAGRVEWEFQRSAAGNAVRYLKGVRGVTNAITLESHVTATDVQSKIEAALKRSAEIDARRINVAVADGKVILTGHVHSWFERDEAQRAAWAAPGVMQVDDRIAVVP